MKKIYTTFLLLFSIAFFAQSLPLNDDFSGTIGTALTANGWVAHSSTATNPILVSSPGLTFTNYYGSGIGNAANVTSIGQDISRQFTAITSGTVYASFLVKATASTLSNGYFFAFGNNATADTAYRGQLLINQDTDPSKFKFGFSANATIKYTPLSYNYGQTYLVVIKYTVVPTGTLNANGIDGRDETSLYVFDATANINFEPNTATIGIEDTASIDIIPGRVVLRQDNTISPNVVVDGLRIAQNWNLTANSFGYPLPLNDDFSGNNGSDLTLNGWVAHSSSATNPIKITSPGLTFSNYFGSGVGNAAAVTSVGQDVSLPFPTVTSGSVYASFLVNASASVLENQYFFAFGAFNTNDAAYRGKVMINKDSSDPTKFKFGFAANATNKFTPNLYEYGKTYLVVVKYTVVPTGTLNSNGTDGRDETSLYVFDSSANFTTQPNSPSIGIEDTDSADISPGRVALRQDNTTSPNIIVDGIRIAQNWNLNANSLGINNQEVISYSVFPNPVKDGVLYFTSETGDKSIEMYDLLGKKVFSSSKISDKVNIQSLKTGMYIARIKTDKGIAVQKIIIEN